MGSQPLGGAVVAGTQSLVHWLLFGRSRWTRWSPEVTQQLPGTHFRAQQKSVTLLRSLLVVHRARAGDAPPGREVGVSTAPYVASGARPVEYTFRRSWACRRRKSRRSCGRCRRGSRPGADAREAERGRRVCGLAGGVGVGRVVAERADVILAQPCLTSHAKPVHHGGPAAAPLSVPESAFVPLSFAAAVVVERAVHEPGVAGPRVGRALAGIVLARIDVLAGVLRLRGAGSCRSRPACPRHGGRRARVTSPSTPRLELVLLPHPWASGAMALPATMAHVNGLSPL